MLPCASLMGPDQNRQLRASCERRRPAGLPSTYSASLCGWLPRTVVRPAGETTGSVSCGHGRVQVVRKQYHLWPSAAGFDAWDVDRLIALSRELPARAVAVDSIREVDTVYWFDSSTGGPTVRAIVEHTRLIMEADVSFPVILGHDGRVMDGMHRIARAMLEGRRSGRCASRRFPNRTSATASPRTSRTD